MARGLVLIHWWVARGILGGWKSDQLEREVQRLEVSRAAATSAEGQSLRRLERDIHDGPQQRLVRLQMDLAAAERKMKSDPKGAQVLINEAMAQSKEAWTSCGRCPADSPRPSCSTAVSSRRWSRRPCAAR